MQYKLDIKGPLNGNDHLWSAVPLSTFEVPALGDALQIVDPNIGEVTIRRITNKSGASGDVSLVNASGNTVTFTLEAGASRTGMFNIVRSTGSTLAATALEADV